MQFYQITILFIITMKALVHCIKNISPIIFFMGEIDLKDIDNYKCRVVGNAFFEESGKNLFKLKKPKSLLLVSDGKYTRDELVDLAIQLSKKFKDFIIYYKLRPEEYEIG